MSAPGDFKVVLRDPRQDAPGLLAMLAFLCALCTWGAVALDNGWRFVLAALAVLLAALILLIAVQYLRGASYLAYIDARGLVATKNKGAEQVLPAERFRRFEIVDPGDGGAVTLKLSYSRDGAYEPPKLIRSMEEVPGRLLLAVVKGDDGFGTLALADLWRLRRFVEETGTGAWAQEPRPR
ncbi:hypothetical protein HUT06_38335 [Actinomadura sp. NAK00032]|uniref:hypothetical protein n=1 Tax=Actinomadura sp. NAK00032 TaxID=2742128 RepID=UPI00159243A2|nr:hypothetical protein [Actinomadura sp. NAK00032]QKW39167.1 hypothetical protein HUT06_38335 [Actinomadura sp. NAK00032]